MIKCLFVSPRDGWAVIEEGTDRFLFHPPYRAAQKKLLDDASIKALVETGGFTETDLAFDDFKSAIDYLDDVVGRSRADSAPIQSAKAIAAKALKFATADQIIRLFAKIEAELVSSKDHGDLEEAVVEILGAEISRRTPEIMGSGLGLLRKIVQMRAERNHAIDRSVDVSVIFPYCKEKYGSEALLAISTLFSQRRTMFAF